MGTSKKLRSLALILLVLGTGCERASQGDSLSVAKAKNKESLDSKREEKLARFIAETIEDKYTEIKLAELANTKSTDKKIQDFAQRATSQYTGTLENLKKIAAQQNISIPLEEGESTVKKVNALIDTEGEAFDKKWCNALIKKHQISIRRYEKFLRRKEATPEVSMVIRNARDQLEEQLTNLKALEKLATN